MATIISNDVATRDEYTATAGQTTFPYTFWAKEADHIDVYVNGVLKTLTTDYTVSAVETDGGADIVFNSGLTLDDAVVITLNPDIERLADYQTSGNLKATTLNTELAYITSLFQYINTKIGRGLSLAETTTGVTSVEIAPAASKLIGWDAAATSLTTYSIGDISTSIDTVFSGLASGDYIQYDGTNWVNKTNAQIKTDLGLKLNNYIATSAPTVNDDSADGYGVGSRWYDTTADNMYHCLDASVGAAVWQQGDVVASDLGSAALADTTDFATAAQGALADSALQPNSVQATKVTQSAGQSISNSTLTALAFDTESFDIGGWHDNATNNSRITVDYTGYARVWARAGFTTAANGRYAIILYKNGSEIDRIDLQLGSTTGQIIEYSNFIDVTASDYLEIYIFQTTGASRTTTGAFFAVEKVL